jgi:hypothetical protein
VGKGAHDPSLPPTSKTTNKIKAFTQFWLSGFALTVCKLFADSEGDELIAGAGAAKLLTDLSFGP